MCQITSNPYSDSQAITLTDASFATGSLRITSYARPGKLFTANQRLIVSEAGRLKSAEFGRIIEVVINVFKASL